jgi:hypothetical protein
MELRECNWGVLWSHADKTTACCLSVCLSVCLSIYLSVFARVTRMARLKQAAMLVLLDSVYLLSCVCMLVVCAV